MLQKEVIETGEKIASDLIDANVSKNMGNMGGHIIKDISKYDNSDLIQKYIDGEIVSVEAIYTAMKRVEENGSSHNSAMDEIAASLTEAIGHICGGTYEQAIYHIEDVLRQLRQ